jgi:protein gp37
MSGSSDIEWTDATWNPVRGCVKVSPGCKHCYAEAFAERFRGVAGHPYEQGFEPRTAPDQLDAPLHWRKPRTIFVNSMSDLFGEFVEDDYLRKVFSVMERAKQHIYQVLTKRSARVPEFCNEYFVATQTTIGPPRHIHIGVSVEDRKYGLPRIADLQRARVGLRFLSIEPLLEDLGEFDMTGIHWIIVGGESGHSARPMHPDWVRRIREQCIAAKVPLFFKQWGAWLPAERVDANHVRLVVDAGAKVPARLAWHRWDDGQMSALVGKKAAGRLLDGRTWDEMPCGRAAPKQQAFRLPIVS